MRRNKIFQLTICLLIIMSMMIPSVTWAATTTKPTTPKPTWCWEGGSKHVTPVGIGWYSTFKEAQNAALKYLAINEQYTNFEVQECDCGKFTAYVTSNTTTHTHSWNNGVVSTSPTCTSTGIKTYTCTGCNQTKTENISALGHSYKDKVTAPTCTVNGYTTHTCTRCNYSYTDNTTKAIGHSYAQTITKPTCVDSGYTTYVCTKCKDTYQSDFVSAKGHNYIYIPSNGKTHIVACSNCDIEELQNCSLEEVNDELICRLCNASYEKEKPTEKEESTTSGTVDPEEPKPHTHTWNDGIITKEATCIEKGERIYTCTGCNETKTEDIPTINHNYNKSVIEPTCTKGGYTKYICSNCGNEVQTNHTEPIEHNYNATIVKPTCTVKGYTIHTCTRCNYSYKDNITNVIAHNYDKGKITKSASCNVTGVKTYTCTVCKATKTQSISKKAHTYKTITTRATISKTGSIATKCSTCGYKKSSSTIYSPKTIKLSGTSYVYNGKVKIPTVTVKNSRGTTLKKDKDYTVTYAKGRKNVGRYSVKITFKGKYSGSKILYFNIVPKGTTVSKLKAKSKGFTVQWTKQRTQTTGYQIQYSTSSNFKNAKTITIKKNTNYAKSITKLKGKKKYYVRIRTYKVVKFNGKNYNIYSPYCASKAITTKR